MERCEFYFRKKFFGEKAKRSRTPLPSLSREILKSLERSESPVSLKRERKATI